MKNLTRKQLNLRTCQTHVHPSYTASYSRTPKQHIQMNYKEEEGKNISIASTEKLEHK